jgi:uncharacterized membrane protein YeaQ/YmgE (transglycosylase-associated protein family)
MGSRSQMLRHQRSGRGKKGCLMSRRACFCLRVWLIDTKQAHGVCRKEEGLHSSKPCALSTETGTHLHEKEDALFTVLGELPLITIDLGNVHLALYLSQVMYLLVAAFVGFVAEFIVGWRLPFGIIGALIAALVGIWIVTNVVILIIPGDPDLFGIPLFKALIGATLFAALWYLLTYRIWHHRRPYYQRRVPA